LRISTAELDTHFWTSCSVFCIVVVVFGTNSYFHLQAVLIEVKLLTFLSIHNINIIWCSSKESEYSEDIQDRERREKNRLDSEKWKQI